MAGYQRLPVTDMSGDQYPSVSAGGMRQQQQQIIRDQDEGLDALADVISRQRQMASAINTEINEQNILIEDISDLAERGASRISQQTRQVRAVDHRASRTCWYWMVIVALLVAIVIVFLI